MNKSKKWKKLKFIKITNRHVINAKKLKNKLKNSKMVAIGRAPPAGRILAMASHSPAAPRPSHGRSQPSHTPAQPGHARNSIRCTKRAGGTRIHDLIAWRQLSYHWATFCFVIYACDICYLYYLWCQVKITKKWWGNKGSNPGRWGREALSYHCAKISLVSCSSIFFCIGIRSGRLDHSGCAASLI
jgi:hypothetical protein